MPTINPAALRFGCVMDDMFRKEASGKGPDELPLFQALQDTMIRMGDHFYVEEYHGQVSQVTILNPPPPKYKWRRSSPQCELADLLIVAFQTDPKPSARMTFLQAKSEREKMSLRASSNPQFRANMEQWYLLSKRPLIEGTYSTFNPPTTLLYNAILPSVGTFGFFYQAQGSNEYQIYYSRAQSLKPVYNYKNKNDGRLELSELKLLDENLGFAEACRAPTTWLFGTLVYLHLIGTPIQPSADKYKNGASRTLRRWLLSTVRTAVEKREDTEEPVDSEIGRAFLNSFGESTPDIEQNTIRLSSMGVRSLVLIKTDEGYRSD